MSTSVTTTCRDLGELLPVAQTACRFLMPKGYKLEGQVIVPSNSKMNVQLIVEDKKEETIVANTNWNPGSPAIKTKTENFIA